MNDSVDYKNNNYKFKKINFAAAIKYEKTWHFIWRLFFLMFLLILINYVSTQVLFILHIYNKTVYADSSSYTGSFWLGLWAGNVFCWVLDCCWLEELSGLGLLLLLTGAGVLLLSLPPLLPLLPFTKPKWSSLLRILFRSRSP